MWRRGRQPGCLPATSSDEVSPCQARSARIVRRPGGLRPLEIRALEAAAEGRLPPVVGQRFALTDAAAAHEAIESRATTGKTVLRPESLNDRDAVSG